MPMPSHSFNGYEFFQTALASTLNQMMPQISTADQSGKPSVNPSSIEAAR